MPSMPATHTRKRRCLERMEDHLKTAATEVDFLRTAVFDLNKELIDAKEEIRELKQRKITKYKTRVNLPVKLVTPSNNDLETEAQMYNTQQELIAEELDLQANNEIDFDFFEHEEYDEPQNAPEPDSDESDVEIIAQWIDQNPLSSESDSDN